MLKLEFTANSLKETQKENDFLPNTEAGNYSSVLKINMRSDCRRVISHMNEIQFMQRLFLGNSVTSHQPTQETSIIQHVNLCEGGRGVNKNIFACGEK